MDVCGVTELVDLRIHRMTRPAGFWEEAGELDSYSIVAILSVELLGPKHDLSCTVIYAAHFFHLLS